MPTSTSPDTLEHRIGPSGEFTLRMPAGDIEIHGTDGDTVVVRDRDGVDLTKRFEIAAGEGQLALRTRDRMHIDFGFGPGRSSGFGSITVDVPRRARVTLDTASAEVRADGLRGEQRYRSASGDIDVRAASGPIAIDFVSGEFTAELDGDATLTGRAISGDVRLRGGRLSALTLNTTSGDVEIRGDLAGDGPFSLETVSGDAFITSRTGIEVEAKTITGDISIDGGHRSGSRRGRGAVTIGEGATHFVFKSISGDLHIVSPVAATGAAVSPVAPAPPTPATPPVPPVPAAPPAAPEPDDRETERLAVLRDLEEGRIDVDAAAARLAELEDGER
ncbi:MAG: DUF4097 family beta strand repeat-containing protein [Chloroflexota bacterium]